MAATCTTCLGRKDKDVGGPKYDDLKLPADAQTSMETLRSINTIIELEKFRGDKLIKFDASLTQICCAWRPAKTIPMAFCHPVIE